jgi:hypothetical protein
MTDSVVESLQVSLVDLATGEGVIQAFHTAPCSVCRGFIHPMNLPCTAEERA